MKEIAWPMSSIVYQIYPRSFSDANGDGISDLQGIIKKFSHLIDLGITAIWLSPVYPSPQADFGYDIADYYSIDPIYGTLKDFDALIKKAHTHDIKVLMDYVPNHTSSQHKWFLESKSSEDNPKRDWYIWKDPKPDGSPPNNWLSVFGGSAWKMDAQTNKYYLHTWDVKQPDLNWKNEEVKKAMFDVLRFWMDRGVDGFRVDAIDWLYKDPFFRDEPANPISIQGIQSEYDILLHPYTYALPETIDVVKELVGVLKEYKDKFMVAESHLTLPELIKRYTAVGWKWYQPFNFSLITLPWRADVHKSYIDEYDKALGDMYLPCYVLGSHDKPRVATRIGPAQARVAAMLQLTLRGVPFIYYGEEIGMTDNKIPPEKIQDTFEIHSPGLGLGRDPERTPLQWNATRYSGFSRKEPWLPVNENYKTINVAVEKKDPRSMLSLYKQLITLKKAHPALHEGNYTPLPLPANNVFAFIRERGNDKLLILLNFDANKKRITIDFKNAKILCSASLKTKEGETVDLTDFTLIGDEGYIFSI